MPMEIIINNFLTMVISFYHSNVPEYFNHGGKPHYNFGNKLIHSDLYKKLNPLRQVYEYQPGLGAQQMPFFFGHIPQISWLYGNLDYSFNKNHRHYQAHDEWYPDRKNKTLGNKNGGFCQPDGRQSKFMTLYKSQIPRGCYREIRKFQHCAGNASEAECMNEKISIMEVCPDHILDHLKEKKKWYLKAQVIDNETYKRAMKVSEYNKNRSVSDLHVKDWSYGTAENLRSETTWADDRYDPTKYSHPHRYDNVNFPEQEYQDVFGGTKGNAAEAEAIKHNIGLLTGTSQAMAEYQQQKRKESIQSAVAEVNALNKKEE